MSLLSDGGERRPSWFRRIAALSYDAIAVLAVWFFATLIVVIARKGAALDPGNPLYMAYLLACAFAYCGYCWTHGGQTLGMKAWKIALASDDGERPVGWRRAAVRFGSALATLGLGYVWAAIDRDRRTWHDRLSKTCVLKTD
jgi:uncharacterized RDD family membrane protein YckC